jgi:hypothetical protein
MGKISEECETTAKVTISLRFPGKVNEEEVVQ